MKRRYLGKLGWGLGAVLFALTLQPTAALAAKGIIKIHEGDWTGNLVDVKLAQIILEEEMDYKVKTIFLPAGPVVFEAITGGEIDVAFEFWPSYNPTKGVFFEKWGGNGSIEYISEMGIVGATGWYVPRYVVEGDAERGIEAVAPDLKSWKDLNNYTEVFAAPETAPKGRLVACPVAAWQCGDAQRVENLSLNYHSSVLGSETAHWAEIEAAYKRGEPILAYAWEPHWIHAKFDMVEVGLPDYDEANPYATDWPEDITFNFGDPTFKDRHPEAYQMIKAMRLTNTEQSAMILDVDVNGMKVEKAVRKWMDANEDIWRAWIPK
jgi:glycine betaine/proline transport system substrate-binding protein